MSVILNGSTGITTPGLINTGSETVVNLTTSGNTILGDASTDTLNVGNGGLVKDASGNVGIGTASPTSRLFVTANAGVSTYDGGQTAQFSTGGNTNNPNGRGHVAAFVAGGVADPANTYGASITIGGSSVGQIAIQSKPNAPFAVADFYPGGTYVGSGNAPIERISIDQAGKFSTVVDASVSGLTVGKGGGAIATNTAIGVSAGQANTTGLGNYFGGYQAGYSSVSASYNTYIGYQAAYLSTSTGGSNNTAVGASAGYNLTGTNVTFVGANAGVANTSGSSNVAIGSSALQANTTASNNTAVGYQAGYLNTTGPRLTAVGFQAGFANAGGDTNSAFGYQALYANTAYYNTGIGAYALDATTNGYQNTALGHEAGSANTTGVNQTFIGFRAGLSQTTGGTYGGNTFVGASAGTSSTTGTVNAFIGAGSGGQVTTGGYNTILGSFNGNQGGLDIRTVSNYIILSDGSGNPNFTSTTNNNGSAAVGNGAGGVAGLASLTVIGYGASGQIAGGRNTLYMRNGNTTGNQSNFIVFGSNGNISSCFIGNDVPATGAVTTLVAQCGGSGGVQLTSGATSWAAYSDERLKNVTGTYTNALADIAQLQPVKFTWKSDEDNNPQVGVIAQSVEGVVPEAVTKGRISAEDETEYLSVKYTELIPLLIASIQELKAEIDLLKGVK